MVLILEFTEELVGAYGGKINEPKARRDLAEEIARFGRVARVVHPYTRDESPDPRYAVYDVGGTSWVVEITTDALAEYLATYWRSAVIIPTIRTYQCVPGPNAEHLVLISDIE